MVRAPPSRHSQEYYDAYEFPAKLSQPSGFVLRADDEDEKTGLPYDKDVDSK